MGPPPRGRPDPGDRAEPTPRGWPGMIAEERLYTRAMDLRAQGVLAEALEVLDIEPVARGLDDGSLARAFSAAEQEYARSKSDPARRLAARLAAKRAALRLLGPGLEPADVEVLPARGRPPSLRLSARAAARLTELGAGGMVVSLTHGVEQAAAWVLLVGAR